MIQRTERQSTTTGNVLVFDSGVGGLTITRELVDRLPHLNITFAADNAAFPYGTKTEAELNQRISYVLHALVSQRQTDLIVIACNSASTIALPTLREQFDVPIVGVVPAIKPAAALSKSRVIGLLATPGTVKRPYTDALINEFANDCDVVRIGSSALVQMAEQKLAGGPVDLPSLQQELAPFAQAQSYGLDTVVLACTHFPLLKAELIEALPFVDHWVDSGAAIARRVESLLLPNTVNLASYIATNSTVSVHRSFFPKKPDNPLFLESFLSTWFVSSWSVLAL